MATAAAAAGAAGATDDAASAGPLVNGRLPDAVVPSAYALRLEPNFGDFTFAGRVGITVRVRRATTSVSLHALDVKVSAASMVTADGKTHTASVGELHAKSETITLTFADGLAAAPDADATLTLTYTGELNDKMAGFYRSKADAKDADGKPTFWGVTQFEPGDARRALPCWDEPALKATFSVTLVVDEQLQALSNMPELAGDAAAAAAAAAKASGDDGDVPAGKRAVRFEPTPVMSSYLLAFVVGSFDHVEAKTKGGITMRVYTAPGKKAQGTFALDVAVRVMEYYIDYFGVPYPLPKSDMIAISDFSAGAMENWGLITYRETALLIDAARSSVAARQRVAYVVAHELAHQWFGNLVTMEWWKQLWLNEGFATYVGNAAVHHLFPEWDTWTQFVSDYANRALGDDGLASSHAIEVEVATSAEVNEIFDAISYCKGASVIRMIAEYVGDAAMRAGLNAYLKRHAYANAVTEDLWRALSEASGKDVGAFMDKWVKDVGYPYVSVARADGGAALVVSQARFLNSGAVDEADAARAPWHLSLQLRGADDAEGELLATERSTTLPLAPAALGASAWLKVNAGQSGFFRVLYTAASDRDALRAAVRARALPAVDRLGLQGDAFALAKAGKLATHEALALAEAYAGETSLAVWSDLWANVAGVLGVFGDEPYAAALKARVRAVFRDAGARLGWERSGDSEADTDTLLRAKVLDALARTDDEATVAEARRRFAPDARDALPADLRGVVYRTVVAHGGVDEYDAVLALYRATDLQEERIRALAGLCAAKQPELIQRSLDWALGRGASYPAGTTDGADVRLQDVFYVIAYVATSGKAGKEATWAFVKANWAEFEKRFGDGAFLLARIVSYATKGFSSAAKADDIEAFFKEHPCAPAERTIKQSLETVRANAEWRARDAAGIATWLETPAAEAGASAGAGAPAAAAAAAAAQ